jgi:hypothetical protein
MVEKLIATEKQFLNNELANQLNFNLLNKESESEPKHF